MKSANLWQRNKCLPLKRRAAGSSSKFVIFIPVKYFPVLPGPVELRYSRLFYQLITHEMILLLKKVKCTANVTACCFSTWQNAVPPCCVPAIFSM